MTNEELLVKCKEGLGIPLAVTANDNTILQKILAVKSFMKGSGTSDTMLEDELAVGILVMGVGDLWNLTGGDCKFSPAFYTLLSQLVYRS